MTIWIVRYVANGSALPSDSHFRTEERARKIFDPIKGTHLVDDFGIELKYTDNGVWILTNPEFSAAFGVALHAANEAAARTYGITMPPPGQSTQ